MSKKKKSKSENWLIQKTICSCYTYLNNGGALPSKKWRVIMKKKQVVVMTMAAVMACGAMTACGGSKSDAGNNAAAGSEASGETGSAEGKQVLSVTTWDNESTPQFQAVIDAYEEKNPDVEIKIIDTSADEYNNSLGISLSAAQPDPGCYLG